MNRALLADLQQRRAYPSVTILLPTTPGPTLTAEDRQRALRLVEHAGNRLTGDTSDEVREAVVRSLTDLIEAQVGQRATVALAVCASPEFATTVSLGRTVEARVVVDDTFATRDLVADLNRTALYRVIAVSSRRTRLLIGDRQRLVEERSASWPLERSEEDSHATWTRRVATRLAEEHAAHPLPTVVAGVERSIRQLVALDALPTIGVVAGNHDRTGAGELHNAAWPIVSDWLRTDRDRALAGLDEARSMRRYAGGLDEIWSLAADGRVNLVVVEDGYRVAARIDEHHQLHPTADVEAPDVIDDVVDELIEQVLRQGGEAVIVADGELAEHGRIAAVLRY